MRRTTSMAPAMDMDSSFSRRSYSSPNLLSLPDFDTSTSLSLSQSMSQVHLLLDDASLAASFSPFDIPSFNSDFELRALFPEGDLSSSDHRPALIHDPRTPSSSSQPALSRSLDRSASSQTTSQTNPSGSWMSGSKSTQEASAREQRPSAASAGGKLPTDRQSRFSDQLHPLGRAQTSADNFPTLSKRSWMSSSRSSSPKSRPVTPADKSSRPKPPAIHGKMKHSAASKHLEVATHHIDRDPAPDPTKPTSKSFSRYFSKIKGKQANNPAKAPEAIASHLSRDSSAVSLGQPASSSIDTHASHAASSDTNVTTPSTSDDSPVDMLPRMLDPLWSSFKTLDMEFRQFQAKSMPQKISQLQTLLLPFLKGALSQAPIHDLPPEDVDRRATILNRWWTAVLDVLEGHTPQTVPGVDRPILIEAATMIMMRPEWRQTTSYFLPLLERSPKERVQRRARSWTTGSETSQSSSQSAMLAESAEHNVRTMFVSNLVRQMAFVVDKMSLRHAPLSMVNFAGKTCAYAFFFAPGVADILLRIWGLTPDLIRRAGDQFQLPRKDSGESDDIVALFPPKLSAFGWTTPRKMSDTLRNIPRMPMLVARIPWTGPWISRWKGRDTDLFFIFCKYFHILADQFMPPGLPLTEKARAPAFVLVHAQLLSTIDATIHRQVPGEAAGVAGGSSLVNVQGADAALTMPPLPPSNMMKGMSENRCIILLKDILSNDNHRVKGARHTFAAAFAAMMKAAACRTSGYDGNACFTLCDFLETVLMVYSESETALNPRSYIDWDFWLAVCKKVLTTLNTISEVRIVSFVYTIWDAVAKDPQRKLKWCRDWLLAEETFNKLFNNWCPMVRAYYQRLLCWRICREKGSQTEVDSEIFHLASKRLKLVWAHYLYLQQSAEKSGRSGPSTIPMSPTLGKRFIIIRQEVNTPQPGLLLGFDTTNRAADADGIDGIIAENHVLTKKDEKKRWSLFGKMLSLTGSNSSQGSAGDANSATHSADDDLRIARREVAESRVKSGSSRRPKSIKTDDSGRSSPVFDEPKYVFKFILGWQQQTVPPRERVLVQPRLPTPAQARISVRSPSGSPGLLPVGLGMSSRRVSGISQSGLIQEARNATSLDIPPLEPRQRSPSIKLGASDEKAPGKKAGGPSGTSTPNSERLASFTSVSSSGIMFEAGQVVESVAKPVQPVGMYQKSSVYAGRSLAEWSLVVADCNNFVERRRDEGIFGLGDVEVPLLSVDGFRKPNS